jgi:hypothetical protein
VSAPETTDAPHPSARSRAHRVLRIGLIGAVGVFLAIQLVP